MFLPQGDSPSGSWSVKMTKEGYHVKNHAKMTQLGMAKGKSTKGVNMTQKNKSTSEVDMPQMHNLTSEVDMIGKTKSTIGVNIMDEDNSSSLVDSARDEKFKWKDGMNKQLKMIKDIIMQNINTQMKGIGNPKDKKRSSKKLLIQSG
jgi:hypothetical protein